MDYSPIRAIKQEGLEYELVQAGEPLPDLREADVLAVDLETCPKREQLSRSRAGLSPWHAEIFAISVAVPGKAWYLPLRHRAPGSQNLDPEQAVAWLQATADERPDRWWVGHNLKFDLKHLAMAGFQLPYAARRWCTQVSAYLEDERRTNHQLKTLTAELLGMPAAEETLKNNYLAALKQKKDYQDWSQLPVDLASTYGCSDAERALRLAAWQLPQLEKQDLMRVFELEERTLRALTDMELTGFRVDLERLLVDKARYLDQLIGFEADIEKRAGVSFNVMSSDEIADVVVNRLGLPVLHRTSPSRDHEFGQPKFDDDALQEYGEKFPQHTWLFFRVRQARRLHHLLSSFVDAYLHWHVNGIVHSNFNQNAAKTGRMSSDDPNLQQVSKEEVWLDPDGNPWLAPGARQYFIPRASHVLLLNDYSQIEYRLFAHYCRSERLVQAYRENPNLDMHQWAADVPLLGLLDRGPAKNVNFGIVYGMAKGKLKRSMSTPKRPLTEVEAEKILDTYYREVPELKKIRWEVEGALKARGFVRTVFGRRRRLSPQWRMKKEEITKRDRGLLPFQALNAICQGSGADIMKDRMCEAWERREELGSMPLVPIHDELISEVPAERLEEAARKLKPVLEKYELRVPVYVNTEWTADRWSEAQELKLS